MTIQVEIVQVVEIRKAYKPTSTELYENSPNGNADGCFNLDQDMNVSILTNPSNNTKTLSFHIVNDIGIHDLATQEPGY